MFCHSGPEKSKWEFIENMEINGIKHFEYKFENRGVETIWS